MLKLGYIYELTMAWSPVGLISSMDRASRPVIAMSVFDSRSSLNFFRFFFNRLSCSFCCEDMFNLIFYIFVDNNEVSITAKNNNDNIFYLKNGKIDFQKIVLCRLYLVEEI